MTPQDYSFLQGFLKEKSGLVLSDDKQYLIESRLMPIARKSGLNSIADLIAKLRGLGDRTLQAAVVEAMTTNESFFFRDKTPFEHFTDTIIPHLVKTRPRGAHTYLVCRKFDRTGTLFPCHLPEGKCRKIGRPELRDHRH